MAALRFCATVYFCIFSSSIWAYEPEPPATARGYELTIKVTPRLGAFNKMVFEEAFDADCELIQQPDGRRRGWSSYQAALRAKNPKLHGLLADAVAKTGARAHIAIPDWDIITTRTPALSAGFKLVDGCGYAVRRVFAAVSVPDNRMVTCEFSTNGLVRTRQGKDGPCSRYFLLDSNLKTALDVKVRDTATGAVVADLRNYIAEDFLLVSLGDSYASGEGNPDWPKALGDGPTWMDAWCHRSAFAGPIQAGLLLMEEAAKVRSSRYRASLSSGAVTIVSFACSGGWVSNSLAGNFDGTNVWAEFLRLHAPSFVETHEENMKALPKIPNIESQLIQLTKLLDSQRSVGANTPKVTIDMLLLSGGGNDVLFGPLVEKLVLKDVSHHERQQRMSSILDPQFKTLNTAYRDFEGHLRSLKIGHDQARRSIEPLSVAITLYPDPTYAHPDEDCEGAIERTGEGGIAAGMRVASALLDFFSLSRKENNFVRHTVITPLNAEVRKASSIGNWLPIDVELDDAGPRVRNHGWCRDGKPGYEEQGRWFRLPSDSKAMQDNLNGAFHPTWELNRKLTGRRIADETLRALNEEPDWSAIVLKPQYRSPAGILYSSRHARFAYEEPHVRAPRPRLHAEATTALCHSSQAGCTVQAIGAHRQLVALTADAVNEELKRRYAPIDLGQVRIDGEPPTIRCEVSLLSGMGHWSDCSGGWLRDHQIVRLTAHDPDSGVARLDVDLVDKDQLRRHLSTPATGYTTDLQTLLPLHRDGSFQLGACAHDNVGNSMADKGCDAAFTVNIDTSPPQVKRIEAHGIDWARHIAPVIPMFDGAHPEAKLVLMDEVSGIAGCQGLEGETGIKTCVLALRGQGPKPAAWSETQFSRSYQDQAGNLLLVSYTTITLPPFQSSAPLQWDEWKALFENGNAAAQKAMTAAAMIEPSLQIRDAQGQRVAPQVLAAWLNLVSGRLRPGDSAESHLLDNCQHADADAYLVPRSVLGLLSVISECARKAGGVNEALSMLINERFLKRP
jgi:hypothetical protein